MSSRAEDFGQPRIRVRRIPDRQGWVRAKTWYEVEYTPVGSSSPEWVEETDDAQAMVERWLGVADAHSVVAAARREWSGGVGAWATLYPGDH